MSSTPQARSSGAGYARARPDVALTTTAPADLCGHDRAVLRAVAAGRCVLRTGCEPLLVVDGVGCADSATARRLIAAGLLTPPTRIAAERARLTAAGHAALAARVG